MNRFFLMFLLFFISQGFVQANANDCFTTPENAKRMISQSIRHSRMLSELINIRMSSGTAHDDDVRICYYLGGLISDLQIFNLVVYQNSNDECTADTLSHLLRAQNISSQYEQWIGEISGFCNTDNPMVINKVKSGDRVELSNKLKQFIDFTNGLQVTIQ